MTTATGNATSGYDSRTDTLVHSQRVGELIVDIVKQLLDRSTCHDRSKTQPPEVEVFDEYTPKLKVSTYGSEEYLSYLAGMGDGLKHHYLHNRHHPEHHATYSWDASPPGRRRPVLGFRYQPSGSPVPSHSTAAATAAVGPSYHQPSSKNSESASGATWRRNFPKVIGHTDTWRPSGRNRS